MGGRILTGEPPGDKRDPDKKCLASYDFTALDRGMPLMDNYHV